MFWYLICVLSFIFHFRLVPQINNVSKSTPPKLESKDAKVVSAAPTKHIGKYNFLVILSKISNLYVQYLLF